MIKSLKSPTMLTNSPNGWGIRRGGGDVIVLTRIDVL